MEDFLGRLINCEAPLPNKGFIVDCLHRSKLRHYLVNSSSYKKTSIVIFSCPLPQESQFLLLKSLFVGASRKFQFRKKGVDMTAKIVRKNSSTEAGRMIEVQYAGADVSIPVLYPPRFSAIYVRLFLDTEEELWRTIYVHRNSYNPFVLPCWDRATCPVCIRLREFEQSWPDIFKYKRSEVGFSYAWLYRYKGKMRHVLSCVNKPLILYGHTRFLNELIKAIKELLDKDPGLQICNPQESFRPFRIESVPEKNDFKVTLHQGNKEPPFEVPDKLPPLSKLIFQENEEPDPKKLDQYLKNMEIAYSKWLLKKR